MSRRDEVLKLLETCREVGAHNSLTAELCRAWIALDAAPEVSATDYEVVSIGGGNHYSARIQLLGPTAKLLGGKHVRLVATPASGGPRNG